MFYEAYSKLINAIAKVETNENAKELIEFTDSRVMMMPNYISRVVEHNTMSASANSMLRAGHISVENYKNRIETLDQNRRSAHDVMISGMNQLNRLCDRYGVEHVCPDDDDRYTCANFAAAVTMESFMEDHNQPREEIKNMYTLVHAPSAENVDHVVSTAERGVKINKNKRISLQDEER